MVIDEGDLLVKRSLATGKLLATVDCSTQASTDIVISIISPLSPFSPSIETSSVGGALKMICPGGSIGQNLTRARGLWEIGRVGLIPRFLFMLLAPPLHPPPPPSLPAFRHGVLGNRRAVRMSTCLLPPQIKCNAILSQYFRKAACI